MDANELMFGNYVYNGVGNVLKIYSVISEGNTGGYKLSTLKPILISEEWLLKFGFNKENCFPSKHHGNYFSISIVDYKYSFAYSSFREDYGFYHSYTDAIDEKDNNKYDFISCGIKHVHQLQNLYFALTGKQLTINK